MGWCNHPLAPAYEDPLKPQNHGKIEGFHMFNPWTNEVFGFPWSLVCYSPLGSYVRCHPPGPVARKPIRRPYGRLSEVRPGIQFAHQMTSRFRIYHEYVLWFLKATQMYGARYIFLEDFCVFYSGGVDEPPKRRPELHSKNFVDFDRGCR